MLLLPVLRPAHQGHLFIFTRGGMSTKIFYSSKITFTFIKFYLSTSKSTSLKIYSSKIYSEKKILLHFNSGRDEKMG